MILVWVTRDVGNPEVNLGTESGHYTSSVKTTSFSYNSSDMCGSPATDFGYRDPGMLHQATITGLTPGRTYYYQFGDAVFGYSQEFQFTAAPLPGPDLTTTAFIYGDMGNGHDDGSMQVIRHQPAALSTVHTLTTLVRAGDVIFHIGDISYARGYANVWDEFFDEIQSVAASVPYMVCIGNHERNWNETTSYFKGGDSGGECGVAYERRFPMPRPSQDESWYSIDYGVIHFLVMSTEHDFTAGSVQYQYLENELQTVNRTRTPWLVLVGHRPMYCYFINNTNRNGIQPVARLLRENIEPLLKNYKVDLALWGHEHAYQRTCRVYQEKCTDEGTVHVIVGMAGQKHNRLNIYPSLRPSWLKYFDLEYGLSRLTANATSLIFDYIINSESHVTDTFQLAHPERN